MRKNKTREIRLPDFGLYYRVTIIKTSMVLAQKQTQRSMEEYGESRNKSEVVLSNSPTTKERIYRRWKKKKTKQFLK